MGDPQYADFPPTGPPYSMEWITIAQARYKPLQSIPPPTATGEAGDGVPRFIPPPEVEPQRFRCQCLRYRERARVIRARVRRGRAYFSSAPHNPLPRPHRVPRQLRRGVGIPPEPQRPMEGRSPSRTPHKTAQALRYGPPHGQAGRPTVRSLPRIQFRYHLGTARPHF